MVSWVFWRRSLGRFLSDKSPQDLAVVAKVGHFTFQDIVINCLSVLARKCYKREKSHSLLFLLLQTLFFQDSVNFWKDKCDNFWGFSHIEQVLNFLTNINRRCCFSKAVEVKIFTIWNKKEAKVAFLQSRHLNELPLVKIQWGVRSIKRQSLSLKKRSHRKISRFYYAFRKENLSCGGE